MLAAVKILLLVGVYILALTIWVFKDVDWNLLYHDPEYVRQIEKSDEDSIVWASAFQDY